MKNIPIRLNSASCSLKTTQIFFCMTFAIFCIATLARIYLYIFHKDLWLDEAALAVGIYNADFLDIIHGRLDFHQSAPLFFVLFIKILALLGLYNEYALYIIPLSASIITFILTYKQSQHISNDNILPFFCISILSFSYCSLYYSTEFKQYSIEMLITAVLNYAFLTNTFSLSKLKYIFCVIPLFSTSSIFIICSIFTTDIIINSKSLKQAINKIKNNSRYYILIFSFWLLYYAVYLCTPKDFMFSYWKNSFIPFNPFEWPAFFKNIAAPVWLGLTGEAILKVSHFYSGIILFSTVLGLLLLKMEHNKIFIYFLSQFLIIFIAAFKFYPLGHSGVIGARLMLFLLPSIVMCAAYTPYKIAMLFIKKDFYPAIKYLCILFSIVIILQNIIWAKNGVAHQQTSNLITTINSEITKKDALYIFQMSIPAYEYYSILNKKYNNYSILKRDKSLEKDYAGEIADNKKKLFILFSHHTWGTNLPHEIEVALRERSRTFRILKSKGAVLYIVEELDTFQSSDSTQK